MGRYRGPGRQEHRQRQEHWQRGRGLSTRCRGTRGSPARRRIFPAGGAGFAPLALATGMLRRVCTCLQLDRPCGGPARRRVLRALAIVQATGMLHRVCACLSNTRLHRIRIDDVQERVLHYDLWGVRLRGHAGHGRGGRALRNGQWGTRFQGCAGCGNGGRRDRSGFGGLGGCGGRGASGHGVGAPARERVHRRVRLGLEDGRLGLVAVHEVQERVLHDRGWVRTLDLLLLAPGRRWLAPSLLRRRQLRRRPWRPAPAAAAAAVRERQVLAPEVVA
mmetsp:Transcript_40147/g.111592  ORF Transcript_40147/g.111592 Transcript_40147/m.111592 type:complete len:276 (+) Transcript_40147:651-1478(+)